MSVGAARKGRYRLGNVLLQKMSDGKAGSVVLEGGVGSRPVLPNQISAQDLIGAYAVIVAIGTNATHRCRRE
jgi:hypothetical protein